MTPHAYFLDTNVLVTAFLIKNSDSRRLLELARKRKIRLLTNEYALKELRLALTRKMLVPQEITDSFILDVLGPNVLTLKKPSRQEVRSFTWSGKDRSDIPIVLPCVKHRLSLVTLDSRLAKSAQSLLEVRTPREAITEVSGEETVDSAKS